MNLYCFDFFGAHVGHIDDNGALFDTHGVQWGELRAGNQVFDLSGRYRGRIGAQGSFYAADGGCDWYVRDWNWMAPPGVQRRDPRSGCLPVPYADTPQPATLAMVTLRIRRAAVE